MAYFYCDTDASDDLGTGADWANAVKVFETLITKMSAGDIGVVQGAAEDTLLGERILSGPGTFGNPCVFIAVADGTTNEGTSIVPGDLVSKSQQVSCTGAANDLKFLGFATYYGFDFHSQDFFFINTGRSVFHDCKITSGDDVFSAQAHIFYDCDFESLFTAWIINNAGGSFEWYGGTYIQTQASSTNLFSVLGCKMIIQGVDLSQLTKPIATAGDASTGDAKIINCKMPASFTLFSATPTSTSVSLAVIGSSNATGIGNTSSVQDYTWQNYAGTVDLEVTIVRTGAADDGAAGVFCYALTPTVDKTKESTPANVPSPWISTWVAGGSSITCTVFIANDGGVDYNEDDVWIEWITPDAGDTAQHDIDIIAGRLLDNSNAVTDDAVSSWVTAANEQKFVKTFTPGYEGWIQARVHFAKRFAATPDTLYLDPKIEVT